MLLVLVELLYCCRTVDRTADRTAELCCRVEADEHAVPPPSLEAMFIDESAAMKR